MPYNGSGSFSPPGANYPAVSETLITAANRNAVDADFATGLTTALTKDGQTTPTANIPLGGYKLTGVGAATARTDAASLASLQDGTGIYIATVGGTVDVITLTASPAITAYAAGQTFRFIAAGANTTTVTVNVSGLGAKALTKNGTTALVAADIASGTILEMTYDGTRFITNSVIDGTFVSSFTAGTTGFTPSTSTTGAVTLAGTLAIANGGTASTTAAAAKIALAVISAATGSQVVPAGTTGQRDGSPSNGYFRYNSTLNQFEGYIASAWGSVGGGATGAGGDTVFQENQLIVTTSYTLTTGKSAMSVGPITLNSGVVVSIPSSYRWVIL